MNLKPYEVRFLYETIAVMNEQRKRMEELLYSMDQRLDEITSMLDEIEYLEREENTLNVFNTSCSCDCNCDNVKIGLNDPDDAHYVMD